MSFESLLSLQGTLFILMLVGAFLRRKGIIDEAGKRCLSDLCIHVVIPCNIFKSFLGGMSRDTLKTCGPLLLAAVLLQLLCLLLNCFVYRGMNKSRSKVMQYCTIVPMSGFLGNPIAEGLYGSLGVMFTAVYLIPMRVVMWSVGSSYFISGAQTDRKKLLKNVLTHPCLAAVYLGMLCLLFGITVPDFLLSPVKYIGSCNTALTMFIVGTILADVPLLSIFNKEGLFFSILRLGILPAAALGIGLIMGLERTALGVSVLMTGMPAGATAAIFAARYDSDAPFATRIVVLTTLLSMVTLPLWALVIG